MMKVLEGKVAFVTGAGSGIGRAVLERFVEAGARVVVLEISPAKADGLGRRFGETVAVIEGDVSQLADNEKAVRTAIERWGRLDVFVGNAGIFDGGKSLAEIPAGRLSAAFDEVLGVNTKGYLLGAKAALTELQRVRGNMIFTASYASYHAAGGGVLYTASKHAVVGLVRQLAYELAPAVRVNGVAPGVTPTELRGIMALGQSSITATLPGTERMLPLQFMPDPRDLTAPYVLLATDADARAITGTIISVDSGLDIRGIGRVAGGLPPE